MARDPGRLETLAHIARELHAEDMARDAESAAARAAENLFYVACVGQFKRGKSKVSDAQQALDDLKFLFTSEQEKLSRQFAQERFLSRVFANADDDETARTIAREAIESWVVELEPLVEKMLAASTSRFADLLRNLGGPDLESRLARRRFYFTAMAELTGRKLLRKRDAEAYLRRLLETNSARVVNDLIDRFVESRRQLEHEVASSLRDIGAAAERAARHARVALSEGRKRVADELERLAEYARL